MNEREKFICKGCICACEFTIKEEKDRPDRFMIRLLDNTLNSGNFCPNADFKKEVVK